MSPLTWKKNSIVLFCRLYRRYFLFGNFAEPKQNNCDSKNRCVAALKQVKKCFHSEISNSSFFFRVPLFLQVWIHSTLTVTDTLTCWCSFPQIQAQSFRLYIYKNQVELKYILLLIATEYRNKTQWQTNFPLILYLVIQTEISSAQGLSMCQEGVESGCTGRNKQHYYWKQQSKEVLVEHLPNLSELQPLPSAGAAAAAIGTGTLCWAPWAASHVSLFPGAHPISHWASLIPLTAAMKEKMLIYTLGSVSFTQRGQQQNYHWIRLFGKKETKRHVVRPNTKLCPFFTSFYTTSLTPRLP